MANEWGFGLTTTDFEKTTHDHLLKKVVDTLRGGLVALPRGAVIAADVIGQQGENFTLRAVAIPDLGDAAVTAPLTEGVAPTPVKMSFDYIDWTVQQSGAFTQLTDVAVLEAPFNLPAIASEKVHRLALSDMDAVARAAIAAVAVTSDTGMSLGTDLLLDCVAELQSRNIEPIPGIGFYALLHPNALRGLTGEASLSGYIDVQAQANAGLLTRGAVGQYHGVTFLTSTKFTPDAFGNYPIAFLGKNVLAGGDPNTLSFHYVTGAQFGNELAQVSSVGYKCIFGVKALAFAEENDGSPSNGADVNRVFRISVMTGVSGQLTI